MNETFSIRQSLKRGWDLTEKNSGLIFKVLLTIAALQVAGALANTFPIGMFARAVVIAAGIVVGTGFTMIGLQLAGGKNAVYADIVPPLRLIVRFFFAGLLAGAAMLLPLIAAFAFTMWQVASAMGHAEFYAAISIVRAQPHAAGDVVHLLVTHVSGISIAVGLIAIALSLYMVLRYMMARFAAVDGFGIMDSLHESARMTRGIQWHLLLFVITLVFLNLLGALVFLVGLLVTVPISLIAFADVYLALKARLEIKAR